MKFPSLLCSPKRTCMWRIPILTLVTLLPSTLTSPENDSLPTFCSRNTFVNTYWRSALEKQTTGSYGNLTDICFLALSPLAWSFTHQQALHWQWQLTQPITYRFLIPSVLLIQIGWFIFRISDSLHRGILCLIVKVYFLVYFLSMKCIT